MELKSGRLVCLHDPKSPVSEAYRTLRTNIQFSEADRPVKSIIVTSAGPGEGKSVTIANTAVTFAQAGGKSLLIDADLRKPMLHKLFGIENRRGLTNVLAMHEDFKEYIHKSSVKSLDILTCGAIPPNPSELLSTNSMKEFLKQLKNEYDHIFIDAPPVAVVTDAAILASEVDGVLLVAAAGQVERDALQNARELLEKVRAHILGVVFNKVERKSGGGYYYYYYYGKDSSSEGKKKKKKGSKTD